MIKQTEEPIYEEVKLPVFRKNSFKEPMIRPRIRHSLSSKNIQYRVKSTPVAERVKSCEYSVGHIKPDVPKSRSTSCVNLLNRLDLGNRRSSTPSPRSSKSLLLKSCESLLRSRSKSFKRSSMRVQSAIYSPREMECVLESPYSLPFDNIPVASAQSQDCLKNGKNNGQTPVNVPSTGMADSNSSGINGKQESQRNSFLLRQLQSVRPLLLNRLTKVNFFKNK